MSKLARSNTDTPCSRSPATPVLSKVLDLYERGQYIDSLAAAESLGDIRNWPGPEGRILAGRLANNLGAPRLGRVMHSLALRAWPEHPVCLYYGALAHWSRVGTLHAWRRFRNQELPDSAEPRMRADWLACKSLMLATLRDFSRAEQLLTSALEIEPESPWLHVERGEILTRQDAPLEALEAVQHALHLQPWFRPAVQSAGYKLVQLNRDEEALQLLSDATEHLQSGDVWCQLGMLQQELKNYDAAAEAFSQAELLWPLAEADSQHSRWLAGHRSDIAYYRGDYRQAIELAKQVKRPFHDRLAELLEKALEQPAPQVPQRVQLPVPFIRQHHETCAPATLTALANYWNVTVQHEEIVERICYEGTMAHDERRWAEENGFLAQEFQVTPAAAEALLRAGLPFTLNTVDPGSAHLQAVVGIDLLRGTLLIQDPSERHITEASTEKFLEHYASHGPRGMVMVPRPKANLLQDIDLPEVELYDQHYLIDRALAEHRREEAADVLQQLKEAAPDHRLTLQSELALMRYDGNTPAQLAIVEKLLHLFPDDPNLLLAQLYCLTELGTREQRLAILRRACEDSQSHPVFWARLSSELLNDARDHREAKRELNRALRFHQGDGRSIALLANLLWDRQQREEAVELYRLAASINDKDESFARSYFSAARCMGETHTALQWLEDRERRFGPRSSLPARTLSWAYEQIDRTPEALQLIERVAAAHPTDGEMQCHVALTLARYNRPQAANEYLAAAERRCPETTLLRTSALLADFQGNLSEARELFLQVYERDPLDSVTLERIVSLDMDLEDNQVAEQRLRAAKARLPHSYSLRVQLIQWLRSNRLAGAEAEVAEFLKDYPEDAWGFREAAVVALLAHDIPLANQRIGVALTLEPGSDITHYIKGRIAAEVGDIALARECYRRTIAHNCDHEAAISALVETCDRPADRNEQLDFVLAQLEHQTTFGDGVLAYRDAASSKMDPGRLLKGIEEAVAKRPDLWHCWSALAQQHLAMNNREKAEQAALEATRRFPLVPRTWLDLALVYRAQQQFDKELEALQRAREINPSWSEVARELTEAYLRDDQFDKAEALLRQTLASEPRSAVANAALAECLYRAGRKEEALVPMASACINAPHYNWAWQMLIDWSSAVDQGHSARRAAEQVIAERPQEPRGYLRLAECLHEIDNLADGLQAIEAALTRNPRDIDAHDLKAVYLSRLHRWDDALAACRPEIFGETIPVVLLMRRAFVLQRKGTLGEAITQLRAALDHDPDHYYAWNQLADWADQAANEEIYHEAAENLIRIDPHQPLPHGYLADALLRQSSNDGETREEAKQHLLRAVELSPDYAYATMRLVDLALEDKLPEEAEHALHLGGTHLPDGYLQCAEIKIEAIREHDANAAAHPSIEKLVAWCQTGECPEHPLITAVDFLDKSIAQPAIERLMAEIATHPENVNLGSALGRLLAKHQSDREVISGLARLIDGPAWHMCLRYVLRSMATFGREQKLLDKLKRKYRGRIRQETKSWGSFASTLLDYGQTAEVVQWTKDWRQRSDISTLHYVTLVAARWEAMRLKDAREAVQRGLRTSLPQPADGVDLLHVWAGLDEVLFGSFDNALAHAQQANPQNLSGWYAVGYRLLVAAVEASAQAQAGIDPPAARSLISSFTADNFLQDPAFRGDRLSNWLLHRVRARIASKLGHPLRSLRGRLSAALVRHL